MRRWSIHSTARFAPLLLIPAFLGCDTGLGEVHGKVTYNGEAVGEGYITFAPADGAGPTVGGQITDGEFHCEEVPPGEKIVSIQAVKEVPFARSSEEMAQRAEENRKKGNSTGLIDPADVIPPDAAGNNAKVRVASGSQVQDFNLTSPTRR